MASKFLKSIQCHSTHPMLHHHSIDIPPSSLSSSSNFFILKHNKPTTPYLSTTQTFSISPATSSSSSSATSSSSLDLLRQHLSSKNFREADEETRRMLIVLAGEAAQKRGYVFFSEVQFIHEEDMKAIDELWRQYSDNKFGYSAQKKIWEKVDKDFTKFFIKVGWMKKLDTEVEQYNYRAFPNEFIWELNDDTPEGHLPLTNALRGTQLLSSIFSHPCFNNVDSEVEEIGESEKAAMRDSSKMPLGKKLFKTDYSF